MAQGVKVGKKKVLNISLGTKANPSTFYFHMRAVYSQFLGNSLIFAGGGNPTKNTLMHLATAFCQKEEKGS